MSEKNMELVSSGLKCDNPACDWEDLTISPDVWKDWINAKCPKCNENVLTLEDYVNAMIVMASADFVNKFTIEELEEMTKDKNLEDLFIKENAEGLEHLQSIEKVLMSVETHEKIKVKITPTD